MLLDLAASNTVLVFILYSTCVVLTMVVVLDLKVCSFVLAGELEYWFLTLFDEDYIFYYDKNITLPEVK